MMTEQRWWTVFVTGTLVLLAIVNAVAWSTTPTLRFVAWAVLAVYLACYLLFGRLALIEGNGWRAFAIVIILASGTLVACSPTLAIVQAISFPLLWSVIDRTAYAIVANVLLAVSVSIGFLFAEGLDEQNVVNTLFIEGISLVGSLALGIWITRISHLSHERKDLIDQLTATQDQLAALNRESGVTSERERLAREIHDTVAQSLTGLVLLSQRAKNELAAGNTQALGEQLDLMEESAREALVETRSLVAASAPVELGGGIEAALDRLGARFTKETGIAVTVSGSAPELERDTEVVLLRCAQESLANVRKHSHAAHASITLSVVDGRPTMVVSDDGSGFDPGHPSSGYGLAGMRDRLALVGGSVEVDGHAGTTVTVTA